MLEKGLPFAELLLESPPRFAAPSRAAVLVVISLLARLFPSFPFSIRKMILPVSEAPAVAGPAAGPAAAGDVAATAGDFSPMTG